MTTGYVPSQFTGQPTTTQLNAELNTIQAALDACFQRLDATQEGVPQVNQMELDLDMNGNTIMNAGQGLGPDSLVTLQQVQDLINQIQISASGVSAAELAALQAEVDALAALVGPGLGGTITASLTTIGNSLGNISGIVAQQGVDITNLDNRVGALEAAGGASPDLTLINNQLASLLTQVQSNDMDINTINNQSASLLTQIQSNDQEIAALQAATTVAGNDLEAVESLAQFFSKDFSFYGSGVLPDNTVVAGFPPTVLGHLSAIRMNAVTAPAGGAAVIEILRDGVVVSTVTLAAGTTSEFAVIAAPELFSAANLLQVRTATVNGAEDISISLLFNKIDE